jgi:hypothetical protein
MPRNEDVDPILQQDDSPSIRPRKELAWKRRVQKARRAPINNGAPEPEVRNRRQHELPTMANNENIKPFKAKN